MSGPSTDICGQATLVALRDLRVGPCHPRHTLPADLRAQLASGAIGLTDAVAEWASRSPTGSPHFGRIQQRAVSIATFGLVDPLRITPEYEIVVGLDRALALAYLVVSGRPEFARVRAIMLNDSSTFSSSQRIVEALAREQLNAVEKCIGLCLMVAEIEGHPVDAAGIFLGKGDMIVVPPELRAMVKQRRKHGLWQMIIAGLGRTRRHWMNILNLLNLCDRALALAHEFDLPESVLRPIATAHLSPDEQVRRIQEIIAARQMTDEQGDEEEGEGGKRKGASRARQAIESILSSCDYLGHLDPDRFDQAIVEIFGRCDAEEFDLVFETFARVFREFSELRGTHYLGYPSQKQ